MPLKILPHGRLQEWVAEEQGYFAAESLEYTFLPEGDYGVPVGQVSTGAFETFGAGRGGAGISCACHWATNTAAGQRAGRLVTTAYSVAPCAVMVPPESPVRGPADLAGVPGGGGLPPRQPLCHRAGPGGGARPGTGHPHLPGAAQRAARRAAGPAG